MSKERREKRDIFMVVREADRIADREMGDDLRRGGYLAHSVQCLVDGRLAVKVRHPAGPGWGSTPMGFLHLDDLRRSCGLLVTCSACGREFRRDRRQPGVACCSRKCRDHVGNVTRRARRHLFDVPSGN